MIEEPLTQSLGAQDRLCFSASGKGLTHGHACSRRGWHGHWRCIGGAILGVSAAAIGGFVGSTVGSVVDSMIVSSLAPAQRIEGQRLDTLRITSASEGAVIPRLYGRMRIGGNIIWATDFARKSGTSSGRRQGWRAGKVKTTEYLYYASFAVALCEGKSPASGASGPTASRWICKTSPGAGIPAMTLRLLTRSSPRRWARRPAPRLSRHGLCRVRGPAAHHLRQPPAAADVRSVPARSPIPTPPRG